MAISWSKKVASLAALVVLSCSACAQQADFNEVGKQMAIKLQNSHFAKLPFDKNLSQRFLNSFLRNLDPQRLYFIQSDVDGFNAEYGDKLHTLLLHGNSMSAANEIYQVFKKRVEERISQEESLLNGEDFDFSSNESVLLTRKDAPWPRNQKEAEEIWKLQIKEAILLEALRRETLLRMAKEQNKSDSVRADRSPKEKVSLRYKRFLNSVKNVSDDEIASYFLSAVAESYDPHTDYMSDRETGRLKDSMRNELVGVGAVLQAEEDGATKIKGIVVGGPADREGSLKLNDRIVAVDSLNTGKPEDMIDIMFMKIDKVVDYIRGEEGTSVALKVEPAGGIIGETKIVVIPRGKVEIKDEQASAEVIQMKIEDKSVSLGVITLPSFYADFDEGKVRCSVDVEKILKRLVKEKIDGLALDLRGNGGGSLEEVRRMTGFFIEPGPVVQVKNTLGQVKVNDSDDEKPIYTGPLIVLTDKGSASATEILAGALQDYRRAVVVGSSSTFGKGTVQQPMDIGKMMPLFAPRDQAGSVKVTIQKFYLPSGSSTQNDGVSSDIVLPSIEDASDFGEAFLDHALEHDRIRPASDFKQQDGSALFLPRLKELSQERLVASKDFEYVIQDVIRTKKRLEKNRLSLNKGERETELAESEALEKTRNAERRSRFAKMQEEDKKSLSFFRLALDDLEKNDPLKPFDPSEENDQYMKRAKDENEELDETPKWPSGLDYTKREA
ncbi:MAG: carboxy terminal-processing peptidase, partial [Akkermansiaceae bacterium]|nr:carboxy terminal-processing peptidase [Akkermansiaceae bacterium]